jgi:hypothetical protein
VKPKTAGRTRSAQSRCPKEGAHVEKIFINSIIGWKFHVLTLFGTHATVLAKILACILKAPSGGTHT